ncbi:MAG TPA: 3-isopropylmalate dehydratase large subunit [Syntrophorhabdaceae bacterium]|nr:3-isopropylmalate dehydratase large subunit [Syntrophorhabdaceae bacterium]
MGLTFAEKTLARKIGAKATVPGQIVEVTPDVALSHDNTAPIWSTFQKMGGIRVFDPKMHVIVLDHATPAANTEHAENHRLTRKFVKEQGIEQFYDVGYGVCHHVLVEEGLALPGEVVLGADSHTPHAGVTGAFGTGIGRGEMASVWALGSLWLRVPESMKILVQGRLPEGVTSKDLALRVMGDIGSDGALYMCMEWQGEAIEALEVDQRAVLTNMSAEMGAKSSHIPVDAKTIAYLKKRAKRPFEAVFSDPDAAYARTIEYDASQMEPLVSCPHAVDNVKPLSAVAGTHVDQAFLGTCTNARLDDLASAATVLKGRKLAPGTRMVVIPASSRIYLEALKAGYLETFVAAGAMVESPGCGPCLGNHMGVPAIGEVVVSTANRNFKGRMGTRDSEVYLASPQVVAASAVAGAITHPKDL